MWSKLKEQFLVVIVTALLVVGGAYWLHLQTVAGLAASQQQELAPLREQNDALKVAAEESRRQIADMDQLLKDAISRRQADIFMTDEEIAKLNQEKVEALADAIARRVNPLGGLATTPEEAEALQNEQIDRVSSRMAQQIGPILAEMSQDQNLTREAIEGYSQRISEQLGGVLTSELAKNQQLNNNLMETQAAAHDALKISHELTALYLSSQKDQGLIVRLLTLPANIVKDVAHLNIVDKRSKDKVAEDLIEKMTELEARLKTLQAQQPQR